MSVRAVVKDRSEIGAVDYLLTSLGSGLAVVSAGFSIGQPAIGWFCAIWILVGTLVSYLLRSFARNTSLVSVDGILYAGAILLAIILAPRLNAILPDGGFPRVVAVASVLCWMMILGSFAMWRDGTLLFQAIPAMALFGLVGCYDTFRNVIFAFFGFLICLATLFARAHTREMLQQAADSGYFERIASSGGLTPAQRSLALFERIKRGPWRWLAGPEWALASAMAVVLVSLLGAPVIQESARTISGAVVIPAPTIRPRTPSVLGSNSLAEARVGMGPTALTKTPVYEARFEGDYYLRSATYELYTGDGWRSATLGLASGEFAGTIASPAEAAREQLRDPVRLAWSIRPLAPSNVLPAPGEVVRTNRRSSLRSKPDGTLEITDSIARGDVEGLSLVANPAIRPRNAVGAELPESLNDTVSRAGIEQRVRDLVRDVVDGAKTDYEKAERIQAEITRRTKYNLRAPAIPAGKDVVGHFLFESREGYCDLFASSMAVMARAAGIPARYVTGYLPDPRNRLGENRTLILQENAHAWAELFFEDAGWVVFDATEGAAVVESQDSDPAGTPWYQTRRAKLVLDLIIGVGALLAAALAYQAFRPKPNPNAARERVDTLYLRFARRLQRLSGRRRDPSLTADEFLELARPALGEGFESAASLNRRFVAAMYGPGDLPPETVATIAADLRNFEAMLKKAKAGKR